MTTENTPIPATPTQVANPHRASIRTLVQSLIGGFIAVNAALPVIQQVLAEKPFNEVLPPVVYAYVNGAVVAAGGISLGVTRLMAIPAVNDWITRALPWLAPEKK